MQTLEKMRTVKVTYASGDSITTSINGTDESIKNYFKIGKLFNIGNCGEDNMQAVTKLDFID